MNNPTASRFTLHILAAVAEHEATMISKRTKEALAARKAKGLSMGSQCWIAICQSQQSMFYQRQQTPK